MVGILPSQIDSIRFLARSLGIERLAFVDGTMDGLHEHDQWERFGSFESWLEQVQEPILAFSPGAGRDVRTLDNLPQGTWLVFGPAQGFAGAEFSGRQITWANIPIDILNSRDAVPIALWELHR